jgi:hypothetical protein
MKCLENHGNRRSRERNHVKQLVTTVQQTNMEDKLNKNQPKITVKWRLALWSSSEVKAVIL